MESVISILFDAKLPQSFWAETVTLFICTCPTRVIIGMTPFEDGLGRSQQLTIFGSLGVLCMLTFPRMKDKKLSPKARESILMGYGIETKEYHLFYAVRRKVFYSRDVKFDEPRSSGDLLKTTEYKEERRVELSCPNQGDFNDMRNHLNSQKNATSSLQSVSNLCDDRKAKDISPTGLEKVPALQLKSQQLCKKLYLVRMPQNENSN